jgi:hypothetical protein
MTLDELRTAVELLPPGAALTLPREALLSALTLDPNATQIEPAVPPEPERWLTADECAEILHVSPRWCYDHAQQLGVKRLSRRCVRFSSRAVARHMARRG